MFNKVSFFILIVALLDPIIGKERWAKAPWNVKVGAKDTCSYQQQNAGGSWSPDPSLLIEQTATQNIQQCCAICNQRERCVRGFFASQNCWLLKEGAGLTLTSQAGCTYFGQNPSGTTMMTNPAVSTTMMNPTTAPMNPTTGGAGCNCGNTNFMVSFGSAVEIRSPNYPSNYPNSCTCVYNIAASSQYSINLAAGEFQTEACCDFVTVYNGNSTSNNLNILEKCSGNSCATVTSMGPYMTVLFQTDSSVTAQGFILYASAVMGQMTSMAPGK